MKWIHEFSNLKWKFTLNFKTPKWYIMPVKEGQKSKCLSIGRVPLSNATRQSLSSKCCFHFIKKKKKMLLSWFIICDPQSIIIIFFLNCSKIYKSYQEYFIYILFYLSWIPSAARCCQKLTFSYSLAQ